MVAIPERVVVFIIGEKQMRRKEQATVPIRKKWAIVAFRLHLFDRPIVAQAMVYEQHLSRVNYKLKAALAAQRKARKLDPPGHAVSDARKISNAPVVAAA